MKVPVSAAKFCVIFMLCLISMQASAQVGEVTDQEGKTWVKRVGEQQEDIGRSDEVHDGDILGAEQNSWLRVYMEDYEEDEDEEDDGYFTVRYGHLRLARTETLHTLIELKSGDLEYVSNNGKCIIRTNSAEHECEGTRFGISANGQESSIFVFDGAVWVSEPEPVGLVCPQEERVEPPKRVRVPAGYWLKTVVGEPIPDKPKKFVDDRDGPGGGTERCITDPDCKVTKTWIVPDYPPLTPEFLPTPDPNPPGLNPPGRR